ncbi:MAG: efflux RND transporter periplasmic adaptor subunit [Planctomycetota bacterium]
MKSALIAAALCAAGALASAGAPGLRAEDDVHLGVMLPSRVVRVGAAADGVLREVLVDRGDVVARGQVVGLLSFEVEEANAQLAKARTELRSALGTAEARVADAKKRLRRYEKLVVDGIVTDESFEAAQTHLRLEELQLLQAEENLRISRLEYRRAAAFLEQGTIRSPIDGVVVERHLSGGELLSKSGESSVVTIAQLHPLIVKVNVPVEIYRRLSVGDSAEVVVDLDGIQLHAARVSVIDRLVDTASHTFQVRLEVDNQDNQLPAGLPCRVRFTP